MTSSLNTPSPHHHTAAGGGVDGYLRMLAGPAPAGRLLEIRYRTRDAQMRRMFVPARRVELAARAIHALGEHADTYVGALLRTRRAGGRDAVADAHLAWVDLDHPDAAGRLAAFPLPPTATVRTGTPGHLHAYWQLTHPVDPASVVELNQRLARHLGGDPASVDAARILRAPGSFSQKHDPPAPVELIELAPARRYDPNQLTDHLPGLAAPAPLPPTASRAGRGARGLLDERLLAIPAPEYVLALTGRSPDRSGKIACPFHNDRIPSMQLYGDGSWYCFGACHAGGSIYDFAARFWLSGQPPGVKLRGREFIEVRDRLAAILLGGRSSIAPSGG